MGKIVYSMFIITLLFIWSMLLISCDAITAQNININSAGGTGMMNGTPEMTGKSRIDDNQVINGKAYERK